uniref:Uncharacterized protein n=1 Tax=Picea glauca TaxID=3330 RepID=A0A101LUA7_PICGL|nr:hypothetical protein ABT39_MTgene2586 [Picea glauca]QHR87087.1 hypothetical protein Q903MT_gene1096 [Picea sitchensis]
MLLMVQGQLLVVLLQALDLVLLQRMLNYVL